MRPGRRLFGAFAALGVLGVLATVMVGCGSDEEPERHTIAILRSVAASATEDVFLNGLAKAGFERDELRILGSARDEVHPAPDDAQDAVRRWVKQGAELIVAVSTSGAMAAAAVTRRVPILFLSTDPVGTGLVRSARRPEGNSTGVSYRVPSDRALALAEDALGELRRIGCVYADNDPAAGPPLADLERGAQVLGMSLQCAAFGVPEDAVRAVEQVVAAGVDAIVLPNSPTTTRAFPQLERLFADVSVPVITTSPAEFAVLTLQPDSAAVYGQLGAQAGRLLDGKDVVDVPVEDPRHFLLVVNLRVAQRIGRTIPESIISRADNVVR